jgi:hypothetical protein
LRLIEKSSEKKEGRKQRGEGITVEELRQQKFAAFQKERK